MFEYEVPYLFPVEVLAIRQFPDFTRKPRSFARLSRDDCLADRDRKPQGIRERTYDASGAGMPPMTGRASSLVS